MDRNAWSSLGNARMLILMILLVSFMLQPLRLTAMAEGESVTLTLQRRNPSENEAFQVVNMFPGDQISKSYRVKVSLADTVTVMHRAEVRPGYEKLAEVLRVRVAVQGKEEALYDGLMRDMPKSLDHTLQIEDGKTQEIVYEITAYLNTSVGNEYQNCQLIADFYWWADAQDLSDVPVTGDDRMLWGWLALCIASGTVALLLLLRRRREQAHE